MHQLYTLFTVHLLTFFLYLYEFLSFGSKILLEWHVKMVWFNSLVSRKKCSVLSLTITCSSIHITFISFHYYSTVTLNLRHPHVSHLCDQPLHSLICQAVHRHTPLAAFTLQSPRHHASSAHHFAITALKLLRLSLFLRWVWKMRRVFYPQERISGTLRLSGERMTVSNIFTVRFPKMKTPWTL